ncbi:histone-lysine N-methyltransferase SETMAR [Nephila pilipes]|uniref:Histone-lysine N-methyltransferase SETMAR n=1 Tax=Nephila pilipes TaxID=299642 RepID=A0A8X6TWF1_NEPPI|nr:histone-lysine N-methyltransferase SETMAR [Nephila pilipes]
MEARGRPSSSRTDINTARDEEIIQRDRRVTVREIASELYLSYGNVQSIVTDELRYSKVCARWVTRALSSEHKGHSNDVQPHISSAIPFRRPTLH